MQKKKRGDLKKKAQKQTKSCCKTEKRLLVQERFALPQDEEVMQERGWAS